MPDTIVLPFSPEDVAAERYEDEQDATVRPGWHVDTLQTAEWAMGRLAELEQEIAENEAMAADAIRRIEARLQTLNDRAMRGVRFFRGRLAEYATANRDTLLKGGKKKSRALLSGTIAWRKRGGGLTVEDPAALLAWAQGQPVELGLVRIREEPSLVDIKNHAKSRGLIPPGMVEQPETEELKIEVTTTAITKEGSHE